MPTEYEKKFVLYCKKSVYDDFMHLAEIHGYELLKIDQHYINEDIDWAFRVRKIEGDHLNNPIYYATYKRIVNGRPIEIESEIDSIDYYDLIQTSLGFVTKQRLIIVNNDYDRWEVDFFGVNSSNSVPYFIMAEIELDFGQEILDMPDMIKNNLLYEVLDFDKRFSNKQLRNISYAGEIYKKLLEELNDEKEVK